MLTAKCITFGKKKVANARITALPKSDFNEDFTPTTNHVYLIGLTEGKQAILEADLEQLRSHLELFSSSLR